jgi:hypothetical protein
MIKEKLKNICFVGLLIFLTSSISHAQTPKLDADHFEDKDITVIIGSRTPEQLSAFYTGRGFNQAAIDEIAKKCFIFGMVDNKTYDRLWLMGLARRINRLSAGLNYRKAVI